MIPSAMARIAGEMGGPISRSPRRHSHRLERYGVDGIYVPLPVRPGQVETALRARHVLGFRGANLTVPHKKEGLAVCDKLGPLARRIGAVNTVVIGVDGRLIGSTTGAYGLSRICAVTVPGGRVMRPPSCSTTFQA